MYEIQKQQENTAHGRILLRNMEDTVAAEWVKCRPYIQESEPCIPFNVLKKSCFRPGNCTHSIQGTYNV